MSVRAATITPRLLTRSQAAVYCGLSVEVFQAQCPVAALAMGSDRRLDRYDVRALDEWIDRIRGVAPMTTQDWIERL